MAGRVRVTFNDGEQEELDTLEEFLPLPFGDSIAFTSPDGEIVRYRWSALIGVTMLSRE